MKNFVILVIALGVAFGVTIPKLYKMCQIKRWIPGATTTQETITQKWRETPAEHPRGLDLYLIAWSDDDIRDIGERSMNILPKFWNHLDVGDQIDVVRLSGDRRPYLRDGIFVSPGNFAFDGIFLAAELGIALTAIIAVIRNRRQTTANST